MAAVAAVALTDKEETAHMAGTLVTEAVAWEAGKVDQEVVGMAAKAADMAVQ